MRSMSSRKKIGIALLGFGCAALIISIIVIVASLSSIYGMVGECENASDCDMQIAMADKTVRTAKYAMYTSVVFIAGGVVTIILSARQRPRE